jgi:CheY-like chemotaxis protein
MRVHLIHWDPDVAHDRVAALRALGHDPIFLPNVTGTPLMRAMRAGTSDVFVIDLSRRPSHGREVAMALRSSPATRHRPIVFADGEPDAVARLKAILPDATFTTWGRLKSALARALRAQPAAPVVPADRLYAGRTLAQKLGLAAGELVAAVGAPAGFAATLGPLPTGARLTASPSATSARFVWFVKSARELDLAVGALARLVTTQVAWIAWPKASGPLTADVNGNDVREAGLGVGLVDFKVCSVDATWSALAFKRRRGR